MPPCAHGGAHPTKNSQSSRRERNRQKADPGEVGFETSEFRHFAHRKISLGQSGYGLCVFFRSPGPAKGSGRPGGALVEEKKAFVFPHYYTHTHARARTPPLGEVTRTAATEPQSQTQRGAQASLQARTHKARQHNRTAAAEPPASATRVAPPWSLVAKGHHRTGALRRRTAAPRRRAAASPGRAGLRAAPRHRSHV